MSSKLTKEVFPTDILLFNINNGFKFTRSYNMY